MTEIPTPIPWRELWDDEVDDGLFRGQPEPQGMSSQEVAHALGLTRQTVDQTYRRAIRKLRILLGCLTPEDRAALDAIAANCARQHTKRKRRGASGDRPQAQG